MLKTLTVLIATALTAFSSTKAVYPVWQPISLHGTDVDGVPGMESGVAFGVVMSRPMVLSGALPEALVCAVGLQHQMQSIGTYEEKEANLLVLYNISVQPTLNDKGLLIVFDLSKIVTPEDMEVGARDSIKLAVTAIKKTLQAYADAHLRKDLKCAISIEGLGPKNQSFRELGEQFVIKVPKIEPLIEEPEDEDELPTEGEIRKF
ncbi:hypothetical protein Rhal01_00468 [Rubritalea halochordaticola]|uniref:Uncharacterized protein n=1 Tax=Rubritalea halochordaticola TaxID=714537 RepID=A0ABP9UVS7_9BACT